MQSLKLFFKKLVNFFKAKKMNETFKIPKVPRHSYHTGEVILYSYYLKTLGIDQTLNLGDWYYIKNPDGLTVAKLYSKITFDFDDFTEFSNGEYIRMITQEEALNILSIYGYKYANDTVPIITAEDGQTSVNFDNDDCKVGIVTLAGSAHAAHLKAAYLITAQSKSLHEISNAMKESKFFGGETNEGEDTSDGE